MGIEYIQWEYNKIQNGNIKQPMIGIEYTMGI